MLKNLYFFGLFICISGLHAQQVTYEQHFTPSITLAGEYIPTALSKKYAPVLLPHEMPYPHTGADRKAIQELRSRRGKQSLALKAKTTLGEAPPPQILDTLSGNGTNGSVPNDDDFAISKNGIMISVRNSNLRAYDFTHDSLLFETTFFLLLRDARVNINGSKFDPRILYDPDADRFIIVFLNGNTHQSSTIVTLFSKTNNPVDGFYIYLLEGNPLNNKTWSDYPHISLSKNDLLITMNTFFNGSANNSGYVESTIRSISKAAGYRGEDLTQQYFSNIEFAGRPLFNFTGFTGGSALRKPPYYFLSNRNLALSNDTFFLVSLSDSTLGNPELRIQVFKSENPYGLPPEARQKNDHRFDCNDARILDGFYENGRLQFVGNTNTSGGNSGFYHGVLNPKRPEKPVYFKIIRQDTLDYGYPNISYTGKSVVEIEAIITFNHSGPGTNSGFSALFFDNDTTYSDPVIVVRGQSYADVISNADGDRKYERWGDYSGAQPSFHETGVVYASGYDVNDNNVNLTALAQLRSPNYQADPITPGDTANPFSKIRFGPNPARNFFEVTFFSDTSEQLTFTLYNIMGKQYRRVFSSEQPAFKGNNTFSFSTQNMGSGLYYLVVQNNRGAIILEEKLMISKRE